MPVILIELYEEFYMSALVTLLANIVAPLQRQFINFIRIAICVVMVWIGGLKVCQYEAKWSQKISNGIKPTAPTQLLILLAQSL